MASGASARYPVSKWNITVSETKRMAREYRRPSAMACQPKPQARGRVSIAQSCAQTP